MLNVPASSRASPLPLVTAVGAALASAHFSPLAAVPSALFSVWHNISGALLSTYLRRMSEKTDRENAARQATD